MCDAGTCGLYRRTALQLASEKGLVELVKALVESGADVHAKDNQGYGRPLHHGLRAFVFSIGWSHGDGEGTSVCRHGREGSLALQAAQFNVRPVIAYIGPASLATFTSAFRWHSNTGSDYVDLIGAGVCRHCSQTALDVAFRNGHTETVKALLAVGASTADVHAKDKYGYGRRLHRGRRAFVFRADGAMRARAGCAGGRRCTMPQRRVLWSW